MRFGVDELDESPGLPTVNAPGGSCGSLVHSYFKREVGSLARAQLHFGSCSSLPKPTSLAAQRGVRYEKKVLALLHKTFSNRILPGPLLSFDGGKRAYPDALLFARDSVCVVEVKFRHTGDAWYQLNKFYLPIVRTALPWFRVCGLEIVASYDPTQRLPQPTAFVNTADEAFTTREAFHPVMVLTERELRNDRGLG